MRYEGGHGMRKKVERDWKVTGEPEKEELNVDELAAEKAKKMTRKWDREKLDVDAAHNNEMEEINEKLVRAGKLVKESGVEDACLDLLRIMWHWPSWSQRDDWELPVEIQIMRGGEQNEEAEIDKREDRLPIQWEWNGSQYGLTLIRFLGYPSEGQTGDLKLEINGELILELSVYQKDGPPGNEYNTWGCIGVNALTAGDWMSDIVDLAGQLRIADGDWGRQFDLKQKEGKADRIKFSDDGKDRT